MKLTPWSSSSSGLFCFFTTPVGRTLPPRLFPTCYRVRQKKPRRRDTSPISNRLLLVSFLCFSISLPAGDDSKL